MARRRSSSQRPSSLRPDRRDAPRRRPAGKPAAVATEDAPRARPVRAPRRLRRPVRFTRPPRGIAAEDKRLLLLITFDQVLERLLGAMGTFANGSWLVLIYVVTSAALGFITSAAFSVALLLIPVVIFAAVGVHAWRLQLDLVRHAPMIRARATRVRAMGNGRTHVTYAFRDGRGGTHLHTVVVGPERALRLVSHGDEFPVLYDPERSPESLAPELLGIWPHGDPTEAPPAAPEPEPEPEPEPIELPQPPHTSASEPLAPDARSAAFRPLDALETGLNLAEAAHNVPVMRKLPGTNWLDVWIAAMPFNRAGTLTLTPDGLTITLDGVSTSILYDDLVVQATFWPQPAETGALRLVLRDRQRLDPALRIAVRAVMPAADVSSEAPLGLGDGPYLHPQDLRMVWCALAYQLHARGRDLPRWL